MVAGEYSEARRAETDTPREPERVIIYQSRAFGEEVEEAQDLLYRVGLARVALVDAVGGEHYDAALPRGRPPVPRSLEAMRREMLQKSDPLAMVCIGGMDGSLDEARLFVELYPNRKVYVVKATGGAAAILAESAYGQIVVVEAKIMGDLERRRAGWASPDAGIGTPERFRDNELPLIPYPLIFQSLVAELIESDGHG